MTDQPHHVALIPAAGSGSRMASAAALITQAKQYLPLLGRPMIAHALLTLCEVAEIAKVFVVLAPDDDEWQRHEWRHLGDKVVPLYCGGQTRAESVANGLRAIGEHVRPTDWVLVHDAARPCLTKALVRQLLREVGNDPVGGLLAQPLADTLKRADGSGRVEATVSRERLWQAQTPQMFRHAMLLDALSNNASVTDEASAIEALGYRPALVASDASNLKVTYPRDLLLAEWILKARVAE